MSILIERVREGEGREEGETRGESEGEGRGEGKGWEREERRGELSLLKVYYNIIVIIKRNLNSILIQRP